MVGYGILLVRALAGENANVADRCIGDIVYEADGWARRRCPWVKLEPLERVTS